MRSIPEGGHTYKVFFNANDIVWYQDDQLEPVSMVVPEFLSHREFLRDLVLLKIREPLSDSLYSYQASRTAFLVYQFKPALKFLNSPEQRILIADEVGLGKTIEAGIIYLELKARLDIQRVLVVCPSGLREKWYSELRTRFDEDFEIVDAARLRRLLNDYERYEGQIAFKIICSLEMLRREEFATALAELQVRFDLVIIDEAHYLRNVSTLSYALGEILADQSDALVLLTATPLHTGNEDLFHLMRLINPGEFSNFGDFDERIAPNRFINRAIHLAGVGRTAEALAELRKVEQTAMSSFYLHHPDYLESVETLKSGSTLDAAQVVGLQRKLLELNTLARVFNRTRKREVSDAAERSAHTIRIEYSPAERAFYDDLIEFIRSEIRSNDRLSGVPIFSVIMRERQAASCIVALRNRFAEALKASRLRLQPEESSTELDPESRHSDHISRVERRRIEELLELCKNVGEEDSKFAKFHQALSELLIEDLEIKVLVFSFFRDTLEYLRQRLSEMGYEVRVLHGGIKPEDRQRIINEFREDRQLQIMLLSEVGAEGLDFQFCGALFNYDLPWNPMKVEQRIGRLDRFGQERKKIQIYNLVIENTIETRIFLRLYERIRLFESSIGDLEAILGEEVSKLSREIFMAHLTPEEEERRAEEAARRIERYRQEQEEFEQQRQVLIGQDRLFAEELGKAIDSGRFVAPNEVRSLIECLLIEAFPRTHLEPNPGDPTFVLIPDHQLIQYLTRFAGRNTRFAARSRMLLQRLKPGKVLPITFDAETARQRKLVEFVTIHHPLALAAAHYFQGNGRLSSPRARLVLPAVDGRSGDFAFFIYRLNIDGLNPQSTLVPVVMDLQTESFAPELSTAFLAEIQDRHDEIPAGLECDDEDFSRFSAIAHGYVGNLVQEHRREAQKRNDALIESRLASLMQSYNFRIESARRQIESVSDERIIRMRRAQIAGLEAALAAKSQEIESRRAISVGYELVASGLVRFDPAMAKAVRHHELDAQQSRAGSCGDGGTPIESPLVDTSLESTSPSITALQRAPVHETQIDAERLSSQTGSAGKLQGWETGTDSGVAETRVEPPPVSSPRPEPKAGNLEPKKAGRGLVDRLRKWVGGR